MLHSSSTHSKLSVICYNKSFILDSKVCTNIVDTDQGGYCYFEFHSKHMNKTVLTLTDLWKMLKSGNHQMLSKLSSLSIASLRKLDEEANKFYDRKHGIYHTALFTRCYTQHALRPYIDSEMNHIRHFIKIPFIIKGIDFIDLPSIFRDNKVGSSIPDYFENKEPPIICYEYNKPIRSTIFKF